MSINGESSCPIISCPGLFVESRFVSVLGFRAGVVGVVGRRWFMVLGVLRVLSGMFVGLWLWDGEWR